MLCLGLERNFCNDVISFFVIGDSYSYSTIVSDKNSDFSEFSIIALFCILLELKRLNLTNYLHKFRQIYPNYDGLSITKIFLHNTKCDYSLKVIAKYLEHFFQQSPVKTHPNPLM